VAISLYTLSRSGLSTCCAQTWTSPRQKDQCREKERCVREELPRERRQSSNGGCGRQWARYTREVSPSVCAAPGCCCRRDSNPPEIEHQADLPAQETLPAQDARLSRAHGDPGRPASPQIPTAKGPQAADAVRAALNRRHRLRGRGRFAALRASGVDVRHGGLRLRAAANGLAQSRVGFAIVGSRSAVERNRLRRRLRAAVVDRLVEWPGADILISVPGTWSRRPYAALAGDLEQAWARGKRRTMELP
jgi:ribonuclease P protein component